MCEAVFQNYPAELGLMTELSGLNFKPLSVEKNGVEIQRPKMV